MTAAPIYFSAYLGLFAALVLSIACNVYLDVQYGTFPEEMIFWTVVFGWTLLIGWRQSLKPTPAGKAWQKRVLVLGLILFFFVFLLKWGMPRGGLYLLAMLQASYNCVTTDRRQLNLGLLVSLTLVMFAASHHRADWTMLFYLVPYIVLVVFTLVAEQIHRRSDDLRRLSLWRPSSQGQGAAILAASTSILLIGGGLYLLTPQVNWPYLEWRYGQIVLGNSDGELGQQGVGGQQSGDRQANGTGSGSRRDQSTLSTAGALLPGSHWPTPEEMRAAAKQPHMPGWQAAAIRQAADLSESLQQILKPVVTRVIDLWEALKHWLIQHWLTGVLGLLVLILLIILMAFAALLREVRCLVWLLMQWDYLVLGVLGRYISGERGAHQYYKAMARLFSWRDMPRSATINTREYLAQIGRRHRDLHQPVAEITSLFEQARYSLRPIDNAGIQRMRSLYRGLYRRLQ